ncbi:transposase [Herbidospora mongoliensis]|uniref:transposase n=1 Tax=Herbidospora mongoliensis TaxID=688067 RepID=UPI000B19FCCB|nr:transposase [Herbidospora mongoliensis]
MIHVRGEWAAGLVGPDVWQTCRELIPAGSVFAFLAEHRQALFAAEMFADMYRPCRHALTSAGHRTVIKPAPLRPAVPGGFNLDDFAIDTTAGTVTCPAGHQVPLSAPSGRHLQRKALFSGLCAGCPLRPRCTTAKAGRILTLAPTTTSLPPPRRHRSGLAGGLPALEAPVERAIAWIVARGNRRLRYVGTIKNNAWPHTRAAALNLRTLINLGLTRTSASWTLASTTI